MATAARRGRVLPGLRLAVMGVWRGCFASSTELWSLPTAFTDTTATPDLAQIQEKMLPKS